MTKKQILRKSLLLIKRDKYMFTCNAIEATSKCELSGELLKHFGEPSNIPEEFRGENWRGSVFSGLWTYDAKEERIAYLKHLISRL